MSRGVMLFAAVTLVAAVSFGATIHVPSQQPTGTVTDYDGNVYQTVTIGSQIWMAENLKVTHYRNGDLIPNVTDNTAWKLLTTGAYCEINNDVSTVETYGRLYNYYAAADTRNIAPTGWHVASDTDWIQLEIALGMTLAQAEGFGWRGSNEGGKLKEAGLTYWNAPNLGATNESGFNALPSGYRFFITGAYESVGSSTSYWAVPDKIIRQLAYDYSAIYRVVAPSSGELNNLKYGFSIRCVKEPVEIIGFSIDGNMLNHVLTNTPKFLWSITNQFEQQATFDIAVGTDNDWIYSEMWNPAPFNTSDTFVTYTGAPLVDGQTYYLRLRISDGVSWSNWYYTSFHMNTPPAAPVPYAPQWPDITVTTTPDLSVVNSTDAENDTLFYDFQVFRDSMLTDLAAEGVHVAETKNPDSTTWTVSPPLIDNRFYYWHARAFDGYEYSRWSSFRFFIANNANEPPTAPWILDPPDSSGPILYNRKPRLRWWMSTDPDPYDQIHYRVQLATDSLFVFRWQQDSAWGNWTSPPDSLPFGGHYWWRLWAIDRTGAEVICLQTKDFWIWTLGDMDRSHNTDISDLTALVDFLYISFTPIEPLKVADLDGDCQVDIADLTALIDYLYISFTPLRGGCGP